jgi:hypothetical protein
MLMSSLFKINLNLNLNRKKSTFSISSEDDISEKRQCLCKLMHDWEKCLKIVKQWNYQIKDAIYKKEND